MDYTFSNLKRNLKKNFNDFPSTRVAITGDSPTQFLSQALKGYGFECKINYEIYEADYNQVALQLLDPSSELYQFNPDCIIIFESTEKLSSKFSKATEIQKKQFADSHISYLKNLITNINETQKCKIIYSNFPEVNENVFGNFSNKTDSSFSYQIRKINYELMNVSHDFKNLFINDVLALQNRMGRSFVFDPVLYTNSGFVYSLDFLPYVVKNITDIILAFRGQFKKCIILDLDNTLWGGIIGDDGIENIQIGDLGIGKAFTELQSWILQLKQRGIILCVCSKNNEETAKEPFISHPDMVIKLGDIAVFTANWENKANNIRNIQSILNIGFDSMVFLDDNPFERNLVKENIPEICVPELPEDPAEYLLYLQKLNLFETASISEEDSNRTEQYQNEAKRMVLQKKFTNEEEFLDSLEMVSNVNFFTKFNASRIAQLTQRSNQFNLRTIRYTEQEILDLIGNDNFFSISFNLADKLGDHGLISLVILEKQQNNLFINTWLMSCRVLKRGVEKTVLNTIAEIAKENNFNFITGEFIPTSKNSLVKNHYQDLGFVAEGDLWKLNIDHFDTFKTYIKTNIEWK